MMIQGTAILLLSGGLDSTVAAYLLRPEIEPVLALTADYGQKAAGRELAASYAVARELGIPHRTVFLPFLREAASGALMDREREVPRLRAEDLDDAEGAAARSAAAVWVPNRNGVLIAMAATWAEINDVPNVVCGFNREEAATFPDNSAEFLEAQNLALRYSTRNRVQVISPTIAMSKTEIAVAGRDAGAPLHLCWPCYLGAERPCHRCESCLRFDRALSAAGVELPGRDAPPHPPGGEG
jgi:7-cyano-7-deazaguanine synthase